MTATPMTLEETLRMRGYEIVVVQQAPIDITLPTGTLHILAAARSTLSPVDDTDRPLGDDLYLSAIPVFAPAYLPVLLSHILDRYRTRRLGYNTPDEWMLAFRRWANLRMPYYNLRYASTAVDLPLDDSDSTVITGGTTHGLDTASDYPQSLIAAENDYATSAVDRRIAVNETVATTGRSQSIMELLEKQRQAYLNVDAEVLDEMSALFLGVFDQPERDHGIPPRPYGFGRFDW